MLIDTHCHLNMMIKKEFDVPLADDFKIKAEPIVHEAFKAGVTKIINVGTSVVESKNCVLLAKTFSSVFATLGTHPNDLTETWRDDVVTYKKMLKEDATKRIVAIGEIGLDYHYPHFDKQRQYDAFRAQIELALEFNLPIVVHTRDASDETLHIISEYKKDALRGIIHCFSETSSFATQAIKLGFFLGIGGTITYPKNTQLQTIVTATPLKSLVLETDAPFLPPQIIRGKQNNPAQISSIAHFIAELTHESFEVIADQTTKNALALFAL